ncbi:hypothetical protein OG216_01090 [Streptomycetaceae bacterium NBC_01309]
MNANGDREDPSQWTATSGREPLDPRAGSSERPVPSWQAYAEQGPDPRPDRPEPGEGCLYSVVRWPARIIALIVVVPLRLLWELCKLTGRGLRVLLWDWFLRPILIGLKILLWDWFLHPIGKGLKILLWDWFLYPVGQFLWRWVLLPVGRAIAWLWVRLVMVPVVFLVRYVLLVPLRALWRYVLVPVGRALVQALQFAWRVSTAVVTFLIVRPLSWLWRAVLVPIGRGIAVAWHYLVALPVVWAWNHVLAPIGRAIRAVWRVVVVAPMRWVGRHVLRPIGTATREVLRAVGLKGR